MAIVIKPIKDVEYSKKYVKSLKEFEKMKDKFSESTKKITIAQLDPSLYKKKEDQ
jgi:hypothetical protein